MYKSEAERMTLTVKTLTAWRRTVSWHNWNSHLFVFWRAGGLWFLLNFGDLWFRLQVNLVVGRWRSRLSQTGHMRPVALLLRLWSFFMSGVVNALGEPVHRKVLHHDCCLSVSQSSKSECFLSEYNPRVSAGPPEGTPNI